MSASVGDSGFSQWTCLPAASAASAISLWKVLGVVIDTTSIRGSFTRSRQFEVDRAKPN